MGRATARALAVVGWTLLGGAALLGLALSAVAALAALPFGRSAAASVAVRFLEEAIAGRVELEGIEILPGGAIELRELRVFDPDDHLVVAVGRARVSVDVTALRARTIGLEVELDAPSVLIEEEQSGISLTRAFSSSRRAPARPREEGGGPGGGGSRWTVHFSRVEISRGQLWWVDVAGATRLEADGLDVAARGTIGPRRARAEIRLEGALNEPVESPLAIELVAARAGDAVRVPVLRVRAGGTELSAVAEGNLAHRRGRLAVTHLGIDREQARALFPSAPEGADLSAAGFAESDGATLTAALTVGPAEGTSGGRGDAAIAARLDALARAVGFDVDLERLDPARLAARAPSGEVTLTARGAVGGSSLNDARARLALSLSRSRLRQGELTRAEVLLRAERGTVEVQKLSAAAPGVAVSASGRWRRAGAVSGSAGADVEDLAAAARNVARLLGVPAPPLRGRARVAAELSGTGDAPELAGTIEAPSILAGTVVADGVRLSVRTQGPIRAVQGRVDGQIARVRRQGGRELARDVALRAAIEGDEGSLAATAAIPGTGSEPLTIEARGSLGEGREKLLLRQLAVAWPGTRWTLPRPASVDVRGPSVDRLELDAGSQQIVVAGGRSERGAIDARVELSRVDLARLPPGALPAEEGVRGELSASLEARGTAKRLSLAGRVALADGAWRGLDGLAAEGEGRLDATERRAAVSLSVARKAGGTLDVMLEVPVPFGRNAEPVKGRIRAEALPLPEILAAARSELPAQGTLAIDARLEGNAGAPALAAELSLADGAWRDLDALGATLEIEGAAGVLRAAASGSLGGRRVLQARAEAPLDLADLAARPKETLRALEGAPLQATASVNALDLAALAGRAGVPPGIAGIVDARADIAGTPAAPRGSATVDLAAASYRGWRRVGAHVELSAEGQTLAASGKVTAADAEALRFQASLGIAPEGLARRDALLAAPLRVEAVIPRVALEPVAGQELPVSGTLEGRLSARGTPRAPELTVELAGAAVAIEGHPLGDGRLAARYGSRHGDAEVLLRPPSGGSLRGTFALAADLGLGAEWRALREAPAEMSAVADALDLGFLPAVAPTLIRSAGGKLALDVRASGPLARLSPRGTLHVEGGRVAVATIGEWTDVAIDARITDELVELSRFEVRRGKGRLSAQGALRGLRSDVARLSAKLTAQEFTVSRAGMDVATFDLAADASGTLRQRELALDVTIPRSVVRLPRRSPRDLQSLERRKDIVIVTGDEKKREPGAASAEATGAPFTVRAHVVVPRNLFVKSDDPRVDIELKADVRYERSDGQDYAEGSIEVVRGTVEPIADRNFVIDRGRVQFTGGPPQAALLDVEAKYQNPAAVVTVNVSGPVTDPEIRLSSQPPMDDAQIAMLIATGRTELKAGSGAVGTLTGEEAGKAALGAVATRVFRDVVRDKLPLDSVSLEAGGLRAGKYLTDKIYVGYIRRFDADPTRNENENEVRVEYQITPHWMFESRYGTSSGGASLIWSREY